MTTADPAGGTEIRVAEDAISDGERLTLEALPNEVGGILVGWWEGNSTAVVVGLLSVPDDAPGRTHYERRHALAQRALDSYRVSHDDQRLGYIGEWHSHPAPQPPSATDRNELAAIVRESTKRAALVVFAVQKGNGVDSYGLIGSPRWARRPRVNAAVVERMTP